MPNPPRDTAILTMRGTQAAPKDDFLLRNEIATPIPIVPGAIPEHAQVLFPSLLLGLPADLLVIFTIADFPGDSICSSYYDPRSPWYNVFYGAYGVRSLKRDGSWWGYRANGDTDFDEILEVPELDYNYLTAAQLGCPRDRQSFRIKSRVTRKIDCWDATEAVAVVPSGLHRTEDAINANPTYYSIFGFPDPKLIGGRPSYEPVDMRGRMFFRRATVAGERITLVWGAMCPETPAGNALLTTIIDALRLVYRCP
jgi:hypothetical protein